jgi:uncharacterized membrane protein HdeD (DUF308 family)
MSRDATEPSEVERGQPSKGWHQLVWAGVYLGLVLALAGVFAGFSIGSRPAGLGTAIVVISLMLGLLIVFSGITAAAAVKGSAARDGGPRSIPQ